MLETRVLCKFLPKNFDDLENFIASNIYSPIIKDQTAIQFKNQRHKIIQETKRLILNIPFKIYEVEIQEHEQQYQKELIQLESKLVNNTTTNSSSIFHPVKEYMIYQTEKMKKRFIKKYQLFEENYFIIVNVHRQQRILLAYRLNHVSIKSPIHLMHLNGVICYLLKYFSRLVLIICSCITIDPSCIRVN